jgi:hypothetical protein
MAKHGGKRGEMDKAEEGTGHGEIVSPLAYEGRKGGNPLSPMPTGYDAKPEDHGTEVMEPTDPLGLLPEGALERGKRGGAYGK